MAARPPKPTCGSRSDSYLCTPGPTGKNDPWDVTNPVRVQRLGSGPLRLLPKSAAKSVRPPTITVHNNSRLTAKTLFRWLKKSQYLPNKTRKAIRRSKNTIVFPVAAASTHWLNDMLSINADWEVTTGELTIILGPHGTVKGQDIDANLSPPSGKSIDFSNDERTETRGMITNTESETKSRSTLLNPGAELKGDFSKNGSGLLLGKTVPNFVLSDQKELTEIVDLHSSKGLVIVVDRIRVKKGSNVTQDAIKVPIEIMEENLIHELAAHAGLLSQGKDAAHNSDPSSRVETSTAKIHKIVDNSKLERELQSKVQSYLDAMKRHR